MNIELKHLQLVMNIEKLGSLSKCADAMYITQPAASHMLKNLESQVGAQIFKRANKRLILTQAGELILEAAKEILPKMKRYELKLSDVVEEKEGKLSITTECNTSYSWLPQIIRSFQKSHKKIDISIGVNSTDDPVKFLQGGELDIAIAIDPEIDQDLDYIELFEDEMLLIVSQNHKLSEKFYVEANHLSTETLIMYDEEYENNSLANRLLIPNNVVPQNVIKLKLTEAILEMVNADMGVTCMSNWLFKSHPKSKHMKGLRITKSGIYRKWFIVTQKVDRPKYLDDFLIHFQNQLKV